MRKKDKPTLVVGEISVMVSARRKLTKQEEKVLGVIVAAARTHLTKLITDSENFKPARRK